MNSIFKYLILLPLVTNYFYFVVADQELERYPIIPKPIDIIPSNETFYIDNNVAVNIAPYNKETRELGSFIARYFSPLLGTNVPVKKSTFAAQKGAINIIIDEQACIAQEGYRLLIKPNNIRIKASTTTGAFWAFQTLRQLMPAETEKQLPLCVSKIAVPCAIVKDAPRFGYRGLHLDVARHMFPISFIKKYIDLLASYKLNKFHWHLTDDQGWRIEIKKYSKLQQISAYRDETLIGHKNAKNPKFDGMRYGGFYTQKEIKEIVEYARLRHITVIPEIDLPGHSGALLAAYPELGCTGGPYKTATTWGIHHNVLCIGNENVFEFLENIFNELLELFPSVYIHIGGDEAPRTSWKNCAKCQARIKSENLNNECGLQSYFIKRVESFLNDRGRKIIGWDEILEGGLAPNATVMSWRGEKGGIAAARLNHEVIMTPNANLYLDFYQSKSATEPLAIGCFLPLENVYNYEPISNELNPTQAKYILGAQANVWTEYMKTAEHVEYMCYPRAIALAELAWTSKSQKDYADFINRLTINQEHLKALNVNYAKHAFVK